MPQEQPLLLDGPVRLPLGKAPMGGLVLQAHRQLTEPCIQMVFSKDSVKSLKLFGYASGVDPSRERAVIKRSCARQPPKMFAIVELELRARTFFLLLFF